MSPNSTMMSDNVQERASIVTVPPSNFVTRSHVMVQLGRSWKIYIPLSTKLFAALFGIASALVVSFGYFSPAISPGCRSLQYHYPTAETYPKADRLFLELQHFVDRYGSCDPNFLHDAQRKMSDLYDSSVRDLQDTTSRIAMLTTMVHDGQSLMAHQRSKIDVLTAETDEKDSQISRLNSQIATMAAALRNKDLEAAARIVSDQQKNGEVVALRQAIEDLRGVMQSALNEKNSEIITLRNELDNKTFDLASLQSRLDATTAQPDAGRERLCLFNLCF